MSLSQHAEEEEEEEGAPSFTNELQSDLSLYVSPGPETSGKASIYK